MLDEKRGIVDIESGMTIEPRYSSITLVDKLGYIVSISEPEYANGYISFEGEALLEPQYKSILEVREYKDGQWLKGLLVANQEDKTALFDLEGVQKTNFVFDEVEYHSRKSIRVTIGDHQFEIDQEGNCIEDCPGEKEIEKVRFITE